MVSIETRQAGDNRSGDIGCMTITLNRPAPYPVGEAASGPPVLDVVIPVYNEQNDLEPCVRQLHAHLAGTFPYPFRITIADNASTDDTLALAETLQAALAEVRAVHLPEKGRGRALRAVWLASDAPVLAYMDVDLSTDLDAILPLVAPLVSGHSDIAIGSRLARGAHVLRGTKREVISRLYNVLVRATTGKQFSDAQCGFKAARTEVARQLLPLVEDNDWFFDTELLVLAEHRGLRIHEVPVDWVDDPDSSVDLVATSLADLRGLGRLMANALTGRSRWARSRRNNLEETTSRFLAIGGVSTVAYLALFLILNSTVGVLTANAIALTLCAIGNAAAHRSMLASLDPAPDQTISSRGVHRWTALRRGEAAQVGRAALTAWMAGLALSTLGLLAVGVATSSIFAALAVVLAANAVVSLGRFLALRAVMYHHHLDRLVRSPQPVRALPAPR
jgi:glycosyltransferase involved in cell wall biosynthesis